MHIFIHLSKPIECTSGVNPNINHGFWVITLYRCKFINCNKCTPLVAILIAGEAVQVQGQGICGKSLHLLVNFAMDLTLSKK